MTVLKPTQAQIATDWTSILDGDLRSDMADKLTQPDGEDTIPTDRRPAAVLALTVLDDDPKLLFIKRPDTMRKHAGQVAFPGGSLDAGESSLQAAMRETAEEVGIAPDSYQILGKMEAMPTGGSDFAIVPYFAVTDRIPELKVNPEEVDEAFLVPWRQFLEPGRHKPMPVNGKNWRLVVDYWDVDTAGGIRTVWGATGAIMRAAMARLWAIDLPTGL